MMVYAVSLIIPAAVLLPNLIFWRWPPQHMPSPQELQENIFLKAAEGIGRVGVMVLPLFSPVHMGNLRDILSLTGMVVFLLLYYAGWIRYLRRDREYRWLFAPMRGMPVPLAIAPVLYFAAGSAVLHSVPMLFSSLILAAGHIPASLHIYRCLTESGK
ncbi:hypothetical protein [Paenibacillus macerans]|uniref:hypothetical protein n=1 Tax=Paenibacillus macerans TaxID=44252 RepID=UPI003D30FE84